MSTRLLLALFVCISTAVLSSCRGSSGPDLETTPLPQAQVTSWYMRGGDATQRGCFGWEGPENANIAWHLSRQTELHPLFELDNGLLLTRSSSSLVALDQSGNEVWRYVTGYYFEFDVTECSDGMIRLMDRDKRIHTIDQNGQAQSVIVSGINIQDVTYDALGRSYVSYIRQDLEKTQIIALNHDGTERWSVSLPFTEHSYQAMAATGERLYAIHGGKQLYAYNLDGELLWQSSDQYESIRSSYLSPDGYCYLSVIDETLEDSRRIIGFGLDGTELFNHAYVAYTYSSRFAENYCGPNNELYLVEAETLYRLLPDGSQQFLSSGIDAVINVDDDNRVHVVTDDPPSYATLALDGTFLQYPAVTLGSRNDMVFGDHGNLYLHTDNDNFSAYHLGSTLEHLWDYTATSRPTNMSVNTQGRITFADKYRLSHYSPDGDVIAEHLLPPELVDRQGSYYRGAVPQADLHLFTRDQVLFAVNDNAALQWQYDFGSYPVTNCLPDTGRIIVTYGPNLSVLNPQGDLVATYLNPESEAFNHVAAAPNGEIYASNSGYPVQVVALTPLCDLLWQAKMKNSNVRALVVAAEDLVLVQFNQEIVAVNALGEIAWDYPVSTVFTSAPAVSDDGLIFVPRTTVSSEVVFVGGDPWDPPTPSSIQTHQASNETEEQQMNEVLIIALDGRLVHAVPEMKGRCLTPYIDSRGIAYFITDEQNMFAVLPSGRILWQEDEPVVPTMLIHTACWAPLPQGRFAFATEYSVSCLGM